jgi:hypothetical protein
MKSKDCFRGLLVSVVALLVMCVLGSPAVLAQSKTIDADAPDWCFGQASVSRVEDSAATLTCGQCQGLANEACSVSSDCPGGQACINPGVNSELLFWDARTDGAVNDLATVAVAEDNTNLYIYAELWVDPDPVSLPFGQLAIDFQPGGGNDLWDPLGTIKAPGQCSVSTDRACTRDEDCWFCQDSFEPPSCCEIGTCPPTDICRLRAQGSGCDAGDTADTTQTCQSLGQVATTDIGTFSSPGVEADLMLLFDFSIWLGSGGASPSVELREWNGAGWGLVPDACSSTLLPCTQNSDCPPVGETPQVCTTRFLPVVDPGAIGGSGGPPGAVELAVPWSAFGCTGCPSSCSCPGFGPGQDFAYTLTISRGEFVFDFAPRGEMEDIFSEAVAGASTRTTDSCPGTGIGTTLCELNDTSTDSFIPAAAAAPGGRVDALTVNKAGNSVTLNWGASCSSLDTDYEVYEGTLASLGTGVYDHSSVTCGTGGTTHSFPSPGGSYYLVVPTDGSIEGSYGKDSSGVERPTGTSQCLGQALGNC